VNVSRDDVVAPALLGVASRRRTLAALLASAITLIGASLRQETDARDKRRSCKNIPDPTPRQQCLASPRRAGARIERLRSARNPGGNDRRSATFSFSRLRNGAGNHNESVLLQPPHTPHKRKHHDSQAKRKHDESRQKRERDRTRATKNKADDTVKTFDASTDDDITITTPSNDDTHNEEKRNSPTLGSNTKTLLWTTLFPTNLTQTNLQRIAFSHFNGFQFDNKYRGSSDDFQNRGVSRMSPGSYKHLIKDVSAAAAYSRDLGMDSLFIRLISADFDLYNQEDIDKIVQATRVQASFALQSGLTGIWLDAEDYWQGNIWNQERDPGKQAYGRMEDEVQEKYAAFGQQFMQAVVLEYPDAEILLAPSLHLSKINESYRRLADFYSGMASVESKMGIVVTTELSYTYSSESELSSIVHDEEQHLADNSSLALGYWARDETQEAVNGIEEAVRIGRQYSEKYNWVYDEAGIFVQDAPHSCSWEGWSPGHSCLAKPLQKILPPL
jgi:hypothetical protein